MHTTPRISLVNVQAFNYLLRSEIFVSEDGQLRAAHLILDYEPLSRAFVDMGQAIRAWSPRLTRIDVSKLSFLARRDLPPVQLPAQRAPHEVAVPGEGIDSSHSSLEAEINHFHFNEEGEVSTRPVELLDSGSDLDRFLVAHSPGLIVAQIDTSQEIEEEGMDLKPRSGLRGLMSNRNKRQSSKYATKKQVPATLPPPSIDPALQPIPNLRQKRPVEELEEGEVSPQKAKQQKKGKESKDKRTKSIDSQDKAAFRREQCTWSPRLELDSTPIPWDATL